MNKTQILTFNYLPSKTIEQKYNLTWRATKRKYLGVTLSNAEDLYKLNYVNLDKEIKSDLDWWATLPLDIGSRIETIKVSYPDFSTSFSHDPLTYLKNNSDYGTKSFPSLYGMVSNFKHYR